MDEILKIKTKYFFTWCSCCPCCFSSTSGFGLNACCLSQSLLPFDISLGGAETLPDFPRLHNIDPLRKADKDSKKKKPMTGQISRPGSDFCEWMSGTIQRFSSEGPKLNFAPLRDWVSFPYIIQAPPVLFNFILKLYIHFKLGCPVHIHYEKYFHYLPSCLFQSDYFYSFFPILPFCWAQDPA